MHVRSSLLTGLSRTLALDAIVERFDRQVTDVCAQFDRNPLVNLSSSSSLSLSSHTTQSNVNFKFWFAALGRSMEIMVVSSSSMARPFLVLYVPSWTSTLPSPNRARLPSRPGTSEPFGTATVLFAHALLSGWLAMSFVVNAATLYVLCICSLGLILEAPCPR